MAYKMTPALHDTLLVDVAAEEWDDSYKQKMYDAVKSFNNGDTITGPTIREVIDREESELQATYPVYGMIEYFGLEDVARG